VAILKENIDEDLKPLRKGGVTFYPAGEVGRIFDWAHANGRTVEWVEGLFYRPTTEEGQLSVAYTRQREGADQTTFRQVCLELAKALEIDASANGMRGYFEIGVSGAEDVA
jgi:hypothetical protein